MPFFDFSRTFSHPLAVQGLVEMVSTDWVRGLKNPDRGGETDLDPSQPEGPLNRVTMDQLWENLKRDGMRDPFILSVGRHDGLCRLEAGNHRIDLFAHAGIPRVPAVVLVAERAVVYTGNGTHAFHRPLRMTFPNADPIPLYPYDPRWYAAPSAVFL